MRSDTVSLNDNDEWMKNINKTKDGNSVKKLKWRERRRKKKSNKNGKNSKQQQTTSNLSLSFFSFFFTIWMDPVKTAVFPHTIFF